MPRAIPIWVERPPDERQSRLFASYTKALRGDLTPHSLDRESGTAFFKGHHGNYTATLESCPCGSYPKPCKHMYRLAMELGVMPGEYASEITLEAAVAELENYTDTVQRFVRRVLSTARSENAPPFRRELNDELLPAYTCPLLNFAPVPAAEIMETMRKKDIDAILDRLGTHPDNPLTKAELIPWCLENASGIVNELPEVYDITCPAALRRSAWKVVVYLDWKYSDPVFRSRARTPPADVVELLTRYGYSQCLTDCEEQSQMEASGQIYRADCSDDVKKTIEDLRVQIAALQASIVHKNKEIDELTERLNALPRPEPQHPAAAQLLGKAATLGKAAALLEKLAAYPDATVTVKGSQTAAPVIWLSGNTEAYSAEIEKLGGIWSSKRSAWYFKISCL